MKLQQYSIIQISARAILNHARRKEGSYYFYYDADSDTNRYAVQKTPQDDCAMYRQLFDLLGGHEFRGRDHLERSLEEALVYLDFSGIFDRRAVGRTKELQDMAEYLFRPEGIELNLGHGPLRFRAFERSASMSRENKLAFIRSDLYDAMWERMTLGMKIGKCQLSKLYAYNGLMFTSGWAFDPETFTSYARRIIVVDNPRSIVKNVSVVTVEDDGGTEPVRRYSRVEKTADIGVLEFDGEGLISLELKRELGPFGSDHYSFQIRLPYIKGVVHTVDLRALFAELGIEEVEDIEGVRHRVLDVDMILTKSMCKGWGWMQENGLSWSEYMDRCVEYGHTLYISNTDRRSRDGLTELNFQLLNTAAITAAEYRPPELPFEWDSSPEKAEQTWLTKATETAYHNTISNESWQLSYFDGYRTSEELRFNDERKLRAELLHKNPAFLQEQVFQKELEEKGKQLLRKFGLGKLMINGDTRYLFDDLMRLLAVVVRPTSEQAYAALMRECLKGAEIYAPQPTFPMLEQLTVLRNPHISRNEEALVTPAAVGPLREKYLSQLYYVAMVDSRSLIPDRLGGADYDGDTVHLYLTSIFCFSYLLKQEKCIVKPQEIRYNRENGKGGGGMTREYVLMNQTTPMLRFSCKRNAFDEPEFEEIEWATELRPIGYGNLHDFLAQRQAPKHRRHIKELLERYGCDDLEDFIRVTHALSLNDTFWVREADSDLAWEQVSLYTNEFDQLVSEAAFDGVISETDLSSTSPEFGTDGYYAKCWVRDADGIWLYKSGSGLHEIEPVSEYLVTQLAGQLCRNYVNYDLTVYHDKLVSKCALFTTEATGLAKASAVFRGEQTIPRLLETCQSLGCDENFRRMCVLDALTLNPDRHYGNFGFLFDNQTMEISGMAPVFDNNRALFPELDEDQLAAPDWYVEHCRPKLGRDFIITARGLMTDAIRADLEKLRGFRFANHPEHPISEKRLDLLDSLVQCQLEQILK